MRRLFWMVLIGILLAPAVARGQTEEVVYYHLDAIGSVRMVTDAAGAVVARYDYLPFGERWEVPPLNPTPDVRQFTTKERDVETGLDYFGARYYASRTGRFTTVDPFLDVQKALIDPQQWNRYAYVRNNPQRYVDPDGRAIETLWDLANIAWSTKAVWNDPRSASNWGALALDVGATVLPGVPAIGGTLRVIGKADDLAEGGFGSFRAFKRVLGRAGDGRDWHHIVEQNSRNLTEFGEQQIHNIANLTKLDRSVHQKISTFYSSKQEFTGRLTFREWLRGKSFAEQKAWGEWVLRNVAEMQK